MKMIEFNTAAAMKAAETIMLVDALAASIGESAVTTLILLDITNLKKLAEKPRNFIEAIHGFGPKKIAAIEEVLAEHGLCLKRIDVDQEFADDVAAFLDAAKSELVGSQPIPPRNRDANRKHLSIVR